MFLSGKNQNLLDKFTAVSSSDKVLCSVVVGELYYGAYRSQRRADSLKRIQGFVARFVSLPFNDDAANIYGDIRASLEKQGMPIGPYDLQIASIALVRNLILVTHNVSEFSRVLNLQIEDWEV
jgi:tRNA(fMet)-specific endonuclease VapC